jgi:selT/selW/selH-like putative selenoprotein
VRVFNTVGPCLPDRHYMVPPEPRLPEARRLQARIKDEVGVTASLVESHGGAFEVTVDGELVYSKLETGEFPRDAVHRWTGGLQRHHR